MKRTMYSAVLSIALLGLTLAGAVTGTMCLSGCADPEKDRKEAEAARVQLVTAADQGDQAVAGLEKEVGRLEDHRDAARAAMDSSEVGGAEWEKAREADRLISIDLSAVRSAIEGARDSVKAARDKAREIDEAIKQGDAILAGHDEEQTAGAVGTTLAAIFPPAAAFLPALGLAAGWIKSWRSSRVYKGKADHYKEVAGVIVKSIDMAKAVVPEFGAAFAKAAPVISAQQGTTKPAVDALQGK